MKPFKRFPWIVSSGNIVLDVAHATATGVDDGDGSVFSLISGATLSITGAAVDDLPALLLLPVPPSQIAVSDTAGDIETDLASGGKILAALSSIGVIAVSGGGTIHLTAAQAGVAGVDDGDGSVFAKLSGGTLDVTNVVVAALDDIAGLAVPPVGIAVDASAAQIQADLNDGSSRLLAHRALLTDVHVNDGLEVSLTAARLLTAGMDDGATAALAHLSGGSLAATDAAITDLDALGNAQHAPDRILVADSTTHIQADLASATSKLLAHNASIDSIAASGGAIGLTVAQITAAGIDTADSPLTKLSGATLHVTDATVDDIAALAALTWVPDSIDLCDSAAAILADLGGAEAIGDNSGLIASVAITDATIDAATAMALYEGLLGLVTFDAASVTIADTAGQLLAAAATEPGLMAAVHAVHLNADATGLTAAQATTLAAVLGGQLDPGRTIGVVDSAANLLAAGNASGIALAASVALGAPLTTDAQTATRLTGLHAFDLAAQPITVRDSPTNLLAAGNAAGIAAATSVTLDNNYTVSGTSLTQLAGIATFGNGGRNLVVQDTAASVSALSVAALNLSTQCSVVDSAAGVTAALDALQANVKGPGHALSITVSGAVPGTSAITIGTATFTADKATLDTIGTAGIVKVTGDAASIAAIAAALGSDSVVGAVAVNDSAANILGNLPALNATGKLAAATISDNTLTAALVSGLLTIPNLQAGTLTIADSGSQIAAAIAATGAPGLAFLNSHTVQLSQDSVVTAGDALALESLTSLQKNGKTLAVWDTATHLTDSFDGYLAAVSAGIIDAVYLKTTAGSATITASTASSLFSIPRFTKNNPDSSVNVLTVQDTAAHIDSAYTTLSTHMPLLSNVVVSASATVTDAVFGHLLGLSATTGIGVNVTVRDTAAAIIAGAPAQLGGSITPLAWSLSGSATVTEPGLAILGGLTGFSAGAYTLTLAADASNVSVADANKIGALGAAFRLGTHHLYTPGSVADLTALSAAAKSIVVPQVADSFANIAAIPGGSALLNGTIVVNDSEAVTVAQASAFLSLLKVGAGPGIPAANVSFGSHVETVTDTLQNIQTLTGTQGWTQNTGVHADFSLVVADTVAHLIDPANTAALAGMAGSTLSGNQTVTAADAESLFLLANGIRFSFGTHTLGIQDSAVNLLDMANWDAVNWAAAVRLAGPDTVSAADAETLLGQGNFVLDQQLTVSDSSDALLDGALAAAIAGSAYAAEVQVELAGGETLDALTAHRLVNLPGYHDNGDLSIQDSASYLLNPVNADAEAQANTVSLAGDEAVSAATAVRLSALPHFDLAGSTLHLASNDYADAATLQVIADLGTGFDPGIHTLTMTQDALALTPDEYAALQSDNVLSNGHALSAVLVNVMVVSATGGSITIDGLGVQDATVTVYDASGSVLTTDTAAPGFTVMAADSGGNLVLTETVGVNAATSESAPMVLLEQASLESTVSGDGASFAAGGAVQVGVGEFLDLYDAASAPANPGNPVLVYDAVQHTLALDVAGHAPVVLVTLGGATTPAHLDASEIIVKHQA